jgi:hypothetical protein
LYFILLWGRHYKAFFLVNNDIPVIVITNTRVVNRLADVFNSIDIADISYCEKYKDDSFNGLKIVFKNPKKINRKDTSLWGNLNYPHWNDRKFCLWIIPDLKEGEIDLIDYINSKVSF